MVPSIYVWIHELPLTGNGKIDRKMLPEPDRPDTQNSYEAPRNELERLLAGIWEQVLELERVGISDNFFELGGHSLLAVQVISRVRDLAGVEVSINIFLDEPTIAALASHIEKTSQQELGCLRPDLVSAVRNVEMPLSFAQQRLWFLHQLEPGSATYNVPCAVRLKGDLDENALYASLNEVVCRDEILRTHFSLRGDEAVQVINEKLNVNISKVDLWNAIGTHDRELKDLLRAEAERPFDLQSGPLIRALLIWIAVDEHVLLLTMHHIVCDGWSIAVLVREFGEFYAAYHTGNRHIARPDAPILRLCSLAAAMFARCSAGERNRILAKTVVRRACAGIAH